jgi:hypothetical protein
MSMIGINIGRWWQAPRFSASAVTITLRETIEVLQDNKHMYFIDHSVNLVGLQYSQVYCLFLVSLYDQRSHNYTIHESNL